MTNTALITKDETDLIGYTGGSPAAREFARQSKAANTLRAYALAWAEWQAWAAQNGARVLPAEPVAVADYLAALAQSGAKMATINMRVAAIGYHHKLAGEALVTKSAVVTETLKGIRRAVGAPASKRAPIGPAELRAMLAGLPDSLTGKRDRALLLVGWAGAFRRSELIALDVADCRINGELKITIRRSKTDKEGKGRTIVIPRMAEPGLCPVAALAAWLDAANITSGPVWRRIGKAGDLRAQRLTAQQVARTVKQAATAAGLDARQLSAHSLRSGFITSAHLAGASERDIAEVSGHKSADVLRSYIQDAGQGAKRAVSLAFGEGKK